MRLYQFDTLRGIGIILVMFGHALPESSVVHNIIYGFHMPLFFVCSGFFFKDKPLANTIVNDGKKLLIPWFTFSMLLVVCAILLMILSDGEGPVFSPFDENCYVLYYTIWFLLCLFIVRLSYGIIYKIHNAVISNVLIWGGYFVAYMLKQRSINIPFFIDSAMAMLLFYHLGYLFNKSELYKRQNPLWVSLVLLAVYVAIEVIIHPSVNIKENEFPIYLILLSGIPIYSLYQLCCRINSKFLVYCGASSLTIMGLHHPIFDVAMFPLMSRMSLPRYVEVIMMVCLTLSVVLIIDRIISKYVPFLLGKF